MIKKFVIIFLIICTVLPSFVFAGGSKESTSSSISEDSTDSDDIEQPTRKWQVIKSAKNKYKTTKKNIDNAKSTISLLGDYGSGAFVWIFSVILDYVYQGISTIHNTVFGINPTESLDSLKISTRLGGLTTMSIFNWFLTIFVIAQCLYFAYKVATDSNFQYIQIPQFLIRIVCVIMFFYIVPYLPYSLIRIAFWAAETITKPLFDEVGDTVVLGFATGMVEMSKFSKVIACFAGVLQALSIANITAGASIVAHITGGLSGQALGAIAHIMFGFAFAGLIISFKTCLQFEIRALEFFIANLALVILLPSAVFSGFGEEHRLRLETLARYYFINMVELFLGGIIILIGNYILKKVLSTSMQELSSVQSMEAIDYNFNVVISKCLYPAITIAIPMVTSILMVASSSILGAMISGGISNNNADVSGGVSNFGRAVGIEAVLSALASPRTGGRNSSNSDKYYRQLEEAEKRQRLLNFQNNNRDWLEQQGIKIPKNFEDKL